MNWTFTNLLIQVITGILGGHLAASVMPEYGFGAFGHTVIGALAGGLSGYFLQALAGTLVTASGSLTPPTAVEEAVVQGVTGAVTGGILTLVVGFIKHSIDHHRPG
jgi:hypothetical protein